MCHTATRPPLIFVQSAEQAGMPGRVVHEVLSELLERAPQAVDSVVASLPDDFPKAMTASIIGGMRRRLKGIEDNSSPSNQK